jgi:hypothetical protein
MIGYVRITTILFIAKRKPACDAKYGASHSMNPFSCSYELVLPYAEVTFSLLSIPKNERVRNLFASNASHTHAQQLTKRRLCFTILTQKP